MGEFKAGERVYVPVTWTGVRLSAAQYPYQVSKGSTHAVNDDNGGRIAVGVKPGECVSVERVAALEEFWAARKAVGKVHALEGSRLYRAAQALRALDGPPTITRRDALEAVAKAAALSVHQRSSGLSAALADLDRSVPD